MSTALAEQTATQDVEYRNPFGWPTRATDRLLGESVYRPLGDPAESIAERLVMLAHLGFNADVWAKGPDRLKRYWPGFRERIEDATNSPNVVEMWGRLVSELNALDLRREELRHDRILLCRPKSLPVTPVQDSDVLYVLRAQHHDLVDRTQMWAVERRRAYRTGVQIVDGGNDLDLSV